MRKYVIVPTALFIVIAVAFALNAKQHSGSALAQEKGMKPGQERGSSQVTTQEVITQDDLRIEHNAEFEARLEKDKTTPPKSYLGTAGRAGYILLRVDSGGPAEKAGLKAGDMILAVNDIQVDSVDDIRRVAQLSPGEEVKITFIRPSEGGFLLDAEKSVTATLAQYEWTETRKNIFNAQQKQ